MQLTSSPRRALGLVAVGAIGMSTAVLGVTSTASAASTSWTFTTASSGADKTGATSLEIEIEAGGECSITWLVDGAGGGAGDGNDGPKAGKPGGRLTAITEASDGDVYKLYPGGKGGDSTGSTPGAGGTNGLSFVAWGGRAGESNGRWLGGGGGGASVVVADDGPSLGAFGGNGGYNEETTGYDGPGAGGLDDGNWNMAGGTDGTPTNTGAGVISGTVTCTPPAPAQPSLTWLEGDDRTLNLYLSEGYGGAAPTTGYQYTLDGGKTWATLTTTLRDGSLVGSITGLTNGKSYTVAVRSVAANGAHSEATAPQTATAHRPIGAPRDVTVTHTASGGLHITWKASPADGTYPIAGYGAGWNGGQMGGPLCQTAADVLSCDVPADEVPTSSIYWVTVQAADSAGNPGRASEQVSANGVPSEVPTKGGDLVRPAGESGSVTPGSSVRITGSGYAPHSTVTLIVYSVPQVLATTVADGDGNIDVTVTIPDGLEAGDHTLVAAGVDADGNAHYLTLPVTVSSGAAAPQLPNTGASIALPALGGLIALSAGGGLLFAARRRTTA